MRVKLRWKILGFTVLPLVVLALAALGTVDRSVSRQVHRNVEDDLRRSAQVLVHLFAARDRELAVSGQIIARDPKFFSALTVPGAFGGARARHPAAGVMGGFNAITQADLFEVFDARGRRIASAGRDESDARARGALVASALTGRPVSGLLIEPNAHYQASATPVLAGGRLVGVLLLGTRIGRDLAEHLRSLTRSELTFVSGSRTTGSTLERSQDRAAVLTAIERLETAEPAAARGALRSIPGRQHRYLAWIQPLPRSAPAERQYFVIERAMDAETAFLRGIQAQLTELGLLAVLAALLIGFVVSSRITSPVRHLVRGAEEMERGNYDYPLHVESDDEIGYLASRFLEMRQRQRAYVNSLEEVARLKSEFISVASQQLRAPISVIRGYQELMLEGKLGTLSPHQSQALDAMGRSIVILQRIAEDATRMAQVESERLVLVPDDCDIGPLVEQAIGLALSAAESRRVQVGQAVEPGLGPVRLDGPRMVQAIANLVMNGIRFTPDGGRVEIHAWRDADELAIDVSDNGVGIPSDRQKHVFEHLPVTGDSMHHHSSDRLEFNSAGLGLGLSITRGIVEAHGGTLHLESAVGRGSTFTIRIPIRNASREDQVA